ncbi:hypothetical protein QZM35_17360 [Burkholderia sp. AU45274]|nr:hypothetical protein [Burkholderia sp. AU45274]MDN7489478.1 hypothetical protein [Burkholderia sp. AU45274]
MRAANDNDLYRACHRVHMSIQIGAAVGFGAAVGLFWWLTVALRAGSWL